MAKRKAPPILLAWAHCRNKEGILPGKKMSPSMKSRVRSCVSKRMG
jgi:hypothetical protein